jgi:mono/diheme cytochrome c family protein
MVKKVLIGLVVTAVVSTIGLQLLPQEFGRDNPPATATIEAPAEVYRIFRRSCFDCHSNQTHWPWYSRVAPASWLVTADVAEGRARLNFSDWESMRDGSRRRRARRIVERVENGEMPMWQYLLLHPGARLTDDEIATLRSWRDGLE